MELYIGIFVILLASISYYFLKKYGYINFDKDEEVDLQPVESPISHLSFEESLDLDKLNQTLISYEMSKSEQVLNELYDLNLPPGKSLSLIESVKVAKESGSIVWELSKEGEKLLKAGKVEWSKHKESGKLLPSIKDAKNSKFKELIKGSKASKISKLTKVANVVVNAAHIISGADLAQKLNSINDKLDFLLDTRKIDKLSKLESRFYEIQEILNNNNSLSKTDKLTEIHNEIREIRITWRNELEYHLDNIEDPNSKSFFKKHFRFDKTKDKEVYQEVTKFQEEMMLIDYCYALDIVLCETIGIDPSTIEGELKRLNNTANKLKAKEELLTGRFPEYSLSQQIDYFSSLPEKYSNYISSEEPSLIED